MGRAFNQRTVLMETRRRSVVKAISWRIVAMIAGTITTYIVTRDFDASVEIMIWANIVSTFVYYIHERFWADMGYGK